MMNLSTNFKKPLDCKDTKHEEKNPRSKWVEVTNGAHESKRGSGRSPWICDIDHRHRTLLGGMAQLPSETQITELQGEAPRSASHHPNRSNHAKGKSNTCWP